MRQAIQIRPQTQPVVDIGLGIVLRRSVTAIGLDLQLIESRFHPVIIINERAVFIFPEGYESDSFPYREWKENAELWIEFEGDPRTEQVMVSVTYNNTIQTATSAELYDWIWFPPETEYFDDEDEEDAMADIFGLLDEARAA